MSSTKRTITIDKANLQGLKNKNAKNKNNTSTVKIKPLVKANQFIQPNTLKRKLLARIKNHQQQHNKNNSNNNTTENATTTTTTTERPNTVKSDESFTQSLEYLKSLAQNKQFVKHKNKTQKKNTPVIQSQSSGSPQVFLNTFPTEPPQHSAFASPYIDEVEVPVQLNPEPQWGCLKGGAKPTFRTFHNKTCKTNHLDISDISDSLDISTGSGDDVSDAVASSELLYGGRQQRLDEYRKEQLKTDKQTIEPIVNIKQTKQRIITKKYKLGKYINKNGPVIGVLIKNVQTQRNVEKKRNEMRHIPLDTIIARLHKKRLLKVGSTAPPDVLREMYESAVMAGDIENEGNDIALHNFLAGDTDTDTETKH